MSDGTFWKFQKLLTSTSHTITEPFTEHKKFRGRHMRHLVTYSKNLGERLNSFLTARFVKIRGLKDALV